MSEQMKKYLGNNRYNKRPDNKRIIESFDLSAAAEFEAEKIRMRKKREQDLKHKKWRGQYND